MTSQKELIGTLRKIVDKAERADNYAVKLDVMFTGCKNLIKDLERKQAPIENWKDGHMVYDD